jgi:LPXTG-motif cell wall-anchored protein
MNKNTIIGAITVVIGLALILLAPISKVCIAGISGTAVQSVNGVLVSSGNTCDAYGYSTTSYVLTIGGIIVLLFGCFFILRSKKKK